MSALLRRLPLFSLLLGLLLLGKVAPAAAQRNGRPPKAPPAAATPSQDTTSGGASAAPKMASKPAPSRIPSAEAAAKAAAKANARPRQRPSLSARRLRVRADGTPEFRNINVIPYFEDKKAYRAIARAEKKRDFRLATKLREAYVAQFGVQNFYRNTDQLWRLGQLLQRDSTQQEKAKAYFRLALKHHRTDVKKIQVYYDSLEQGNAQLYVPLKTYYDVVEYRKNINTFHPPRGINSNMGEGVNSPAPDYGPALNGSDTLLLFSSKRKRRGLKAVVDEDLYTSRKQGQYWGDAEPLPKPINSLYNEGSACFTKDGKTIFFARCECPGCRGNCDLFTAKLGKDGKWSAPQNLGAQVNSPAWDSQPTLSPGEDTLYFASDRLGGFGLSDIYFSARQRNGQWGPAQNLGPIVNTRENDVSPFYHPLYRVLYFSSRGQLLNFGDFDIYKTYRANGHWQEPKNIGPLVNGKGSEYYFSIDAQSKNLYYARSEEKEMANLDLFSFPLPMEAHPLATTHVEGSLVDSVSRNPLKGIVSIIDTDNGIEVASKYLRPDGTFDFDLIEGSHYAMLIQSPDFFSVEKQFILKGDTVMSLLTNSINYKLPLIFKNLEFEPGKATIRPAMHATLDRIALFLVDHPTFKLSVAGHTDSKGDAEENEKLSQDRAQAIRAYIERKGKIDGNRIQSFGYGSSQPLRDELTEADARVNRRVEFRLVKPESEQADPAGGGWN